MYYIEKLKETIGKATAVLAQAIAHVESPEFKAWVESRFGETDGAGMYAYKFGYLSSAANIMAPGDLNHAAWLVTEAEPTIEWGERCAELCEALGIDGDNIGFLQALANGDGYQSSVRELREQIMEAAKEVRDSEREVEHFDAAEVLENSGFVVVETDDSEWWERSSVGACASGEHFSKVERVTLESKCRNGEFWYEFILEVNGRETLRGKSGEFAGLLAAVGITQEVKQ